jgi:hypothetical protein
MTMSRYAYNYDLTSSRPSGWRAALTSMTVVGTVMAVSAISGAIVTLQLFATPAQSGATPRVAAATRVVPAVPPAVPATFAARHDSVPVTASHPTIPPTTVAAAPRAQDVPPVRPEPVVAAAKPAPVVAAAKSAPMPSVSPQSVAAAAPVAVADHDLTFAKGYAQRRAIATGAISRHGKVLIAAQTQLGRAALKPKPRVVARNNTNTAQDRRAQTTARGDAFGMFQRFDRPDQFDFSHHQALAFGEQRAQRRRNDAPARPSAPRSNSPGGLFGGLF